MRLAIVGDTRHSRDAEGRWCTISPLVRQLQPWLERFDDVVYCGTYLPGEPPPNHEPYPVSHVRFQALPAGGGSGIQGKAGLLRRVVEWWPILRRTLREVDVVHFRCPCNIVLVGLLAARGLPVKQFAVYAGNWGGYPGESPFYKLQRRWLNSPAFGGITSVYGAWPGQPEHVVTAFSPSFSRADWEADGVDVAAKLRAYHGAERLPVLRAVSVGHLNLDKNQSSILKAVAALRGEGLRVELALLGDGPERSRLEALARELGIAEQVEFRGRVALREVRRAYAGAHVGILASLTEGFPRVLAEAMAGGAVPVATDVGINGQILEHGGRGVTFPFNSAEGLAAQLRALAHDPAGMARRVEAGRAYTREITLEAFYALHHGILSDRLGVPPVKRARLLEVAA